VLNDSKGEDIVHQDWFAFSHGGHGINLSLYGHHIVVVQLVEVHQSSGCDRVQAMRFLGIPWLSKTTFS
jgi:hypothetical protein